MMRTLVLVLVGSLACLPGCADANDSGGGAGGGGAGGGGAGGGNTAGSAAGMKAGNDSGKGGSWTGPDGCAFLTQEQAAGLLGTPSQPCRVEKEGVDRRFNWSSPPEEVLGGSLGYFVYANKTGYNREILCGKPEEGACLDLPGIGDLAFLETRTAATYVKTGSTFFFAQCVWAQAISAEDDAALDVAVAASGRPRDMTTHKDEDYWRRDMSCSRGAARLAVATLE